MSVWFCIPSARPYEEVERCLAKWRERGYKVALLLDKKSGAWPQVKDIGDVLIRQDHYPGYAAAVNLLIKNVIGAYQDADWFVCAGDDTEPDPGHTADEIAEQCAAHFYGNETVSASGDDEDERSIVGTFGVMQPTGDRWGDGRGAYIDRVAGSPWMGREWCQRINQGNGPLWPEYFHMGCDEELQAVALKYGAFWQRPDLIHQHKHWGRGSDDRTIGSIDRMPEFLERANSKVEWDRFRATFEARKAAGFPGSDPL